MLSVISFYLTERTLEEAAITGLLFILSLLISAFPIMCLWRQLLFLNRQGCLSRIYFFIKGVLSVNL